MSLKKLSPFAVELPNGCLIYKPSFLFAGDCRICALNQIVCEELEYPCRVIFEDCNYFKICEECLNVNKCLERKPCCWNCKRLMECLNDASGWAIDFVKDLYNCTWEQYIKAIGILRVRRNGTG